MISARDAGAEKVVGFEANGGLLTASPFTFGKAQLPALPTRDCVLPVLCTLAVSLGAGQPLSTFVEGLGLPVAVSGRIEDFPTEKGKNLVAVLTAEAGRRAQFLDGIGEVGGLDTTDGLRMTLADGRILHLRPSGNAPEMRIYAEAATEEDAESLVAEMAPRISGWQD